MNIYTDYSQKCPDCQKTFYSATSLLVHFFSHVGGKEKVSDMQDINENGTVSNGERENSDVNETSNQMNSTNGETFSPWKYCLATYEENNDDSTARLSKTIKSSKKKKEKDKTFECNLCNKRFGWSTDLKRHLLIHTGERPFKCDLCQAAFTRNFLLQKHFARAHKRVSDDESKNLDNHVHANVAEIKLKMKELECQKELDKCASDNDSQ